MPPAIPIWVATNGAGALLMGFSHLSGNSLVVTVYNSNVGNSLVITVYNSNVGNSLVIAV